MEKYVQNKYSLYISFPEQDFKRNYKEWMYISTNSKYWKSVSSAMVIINKSWLCERVSLYFDVKHLPYGMRSTNIFSEAGCKSNIRLFNII